MHGCKRFQAFFFIFLAGCTGQAPAQKPTEKAAGPANLGCAFDPAATGTVYGQVTWQGELPQVKPFKVFGLPGNYHFNVRQEQPNPNLPHIQPATMGVTDAVVFLRQVDLEKSKPWDHPPVSIVQAGRRVLIRQGSYDSSVGWVQAGTQVTMSSEDNHFHLLRGRGAAFFSLPFIDPKGSSRRRLDAPGLVELSSGAFFFWMRGYLFVDNHPYYARTDARGTFTLDQVPAGSYDLVCWMPNWEVAAKSRDPETGLIIGVDFQPPVQLVRKVEIGVGQRQEANFTLSLGEFSK